MSIEKPSIDQVAHHYAGVIIVTESGRIIGQQRDNKPSIDNPGKIGTFGGSVESGEDFLQAAYRELVEEETNLTLTRDDLRLFWESVEWRPLTSEWEGYHIYTVTIPDAALETLEVYEGQGWAEVTDPHAETITVPVRPIYAKFIETLH
jgi:8-oxo-dGTP pyrophosphatase MutT (NUDIX family)